MNVDELEALCEIHHNRWPEAILGDEFTNTLQHIMMKYERQIIEMKVENYCSGLSESDSNAQICKALNIRSTTLSRYIRDIKYKFRNKMDLRVYKLLNPCYNYTRGRRKWRKGVRV